VNRSGIHCVRDVDIKAKFYFCLITTFGVLRLLIPVRFHLSFCESLENRLSSGFRNKAVARVWRFVKSKRSTRSAILG